MAEGSSSIKTNLPLVLPSRTARIWRERIIASVLFLAAISSVLITLVIIYILFSETVIFFEKVIELDQMSLWQALLEFFTGTDWSPLIEPLGIGILPLLSGTLTTCFVALFVAVPLGTIAAIYLSEFAPAKVREVLKPILEILAGIPTVVYGYFALLVITPVLQKIILGVQQFLFPGREEWDYFQLPGFNMLGAGISVGLMVLPYICSLVEDALQAVPLELREGSYAMGATRIQTALSVLIPAAVSGIVAAYILGFSRAVGETMIVAVAAGLQPKFTFNPLEGAATTTAFIVSVSLGDLPHGSLEYQSIFAAGIMLFLATLFMNVLGYFLSRRYREVY
ncbi:MAG: phosphate ABC transporter permease subunit PstC [Thermosynechococcus sp. Uc]|uniref:phosphate ABC transporter permease subunit PstC n=1 Tax=Thermosynechococcus sp. Uc TaxID=3034853 RepID=UPI0019FE6E1C|nr:phosphate ABC transporter permease subunit PstC [Thermosynechococcus sp. Uc]MDM7325646.1 phosphate ABC transporter permease subunit PstC [Thermosynechococcus sp. Uc]HIK26407.1 phosphate ABC transporter permease subunit PstC [Thermosynechococcus sp. M46_R2017_013]